jgi:PAS domain S-box-containing protein
VITAQSGPEGIEQALVEQPDTVLLDVHMPGMDGFETCRRLKADERTRPIPVVMVTAVRTDAPSRIKGLELGADAFLSKPIDEQELVSQLKVALRIKTAEDALRAERDSLETLVQRRTAELRKSEERSRLILRSAMDGFWRLDRQGRMLEVNDSYCRMSGYTRPELLAMSISDVEAVETPAETAAHLRKLMEQTEDRFESRHRCKDGTVFDVEVSVQYRECEEEQIAVFLRDITERKRAENALRESEATVRNRLKAILEPEGDIGTLNLADVVDLQALQTMMEDFYRLSRIGSAILDVSGRVLVAVGWQDICTKFHRVHPETAKNCQESDLTLAEGVLAGTFKAYRCKNHMWDVVTPIKVKGKHLGSIYLGQFFFADEIPDYELFRRQARQHGFDETKYLAALDRVPRWSRETVDAVMAFYAKLAGMISSLSYGTVKLSRDLAERKRVEAALRESEQKYRKLTESMKDVVWTLDTETMYFTYVSPSVADLCGYSPEEILSEPVDAPLTADAIDDLKTLIRQRSADYLANREGREDYYTDEVELPCKDGSRVWTEGITRYVLNEETGHVELHGVTRDITERKRAEAEKQKLEEQLRQALKMESVGRLAGGVAHDFNNMLGVILGYTDMALDHVDPAQPLFAALQEIRKASERSADLTRQLLTFARKQTIAPKVIDLNETVDGMLKLLRRLIGEDIDLVWKPGRNLGPVKVDPSQVHQLLANLCVNARDAIPGVGKLTIETDAAAFDEAWCATHTGFVPGEYVLLAVSDNGCGMDQETLGHLFEPFFTTKGVGKGTGLGLATVYGMVQQNNGFINVDSEPSQGTTFKVYLPRHAAQTASLSETAPGRSAERGDETILLVEDEPAILKMATMMLERLGYAVVGARTPGEAVRLAEAHAGGIHLLVTDVVMPDMNGRDLAEHLLSMYPNLKCLFMSGYTADIIAHQGVLAARVQFIQKPFSLTDLAAKVRQALGDEQRKE